MNKKILLFILSILVLSSFASANAGRYNPGDYLEFDDGDTQFDGGNDTTNGMALTTGGWTAQTGTSATYSSTLAKNGTYAILMNAANLPYYYNDFGDATYDENTNYTMSYDMNIPVAAELKMFLGFTFDEAGTQPGNPSILGSGVYGCGAQYNCGSAAQNCFGTVTTGWHKIMLTTVHRAGNVILRCDIDDGTYVQETTKLEDWWDSPNIEDEIRGWKSLGRDNSNNVYYDKHY